MVHILGETSHGYTAVIVVQTISNEQNNSDKVDLTIIKTPDLTSTAYSTRVEYDQVTDISPLVGINLLEYVSLKKCEKRDYTPVLDLARAWGAKYPDRWPALLLEHPAYLICLLESDYAVPEKKPSLPSPDELIAAIDQIWRELEGFPEQQSRIALR